MQQIAGEKPSGFQRTHFVDCSILPPIPAGPLTLTMMANALSNREGVSFMKPISLCNYWCQWPFRLFF